MGGGTRTKLDFGNTWGSGRLPLRYENATITSSPHDDNFAIAKDPVYKIEYRPNGGVGTIPSQLVPLGKVVNLSSNNQSGFRRNGHTATAWSTTPNGDGMRYKLGQTILVENDLTLYALWARSPIRK